MKLNGKLTALVIAACVSLSGAYALDGTDFITNYDSYSQSISSGLDDFAGALAVAVPQAATQQNVWADAYIGKLFPSVPFHLGGGFNVGVTHIDTSGLAKAAKTLDISGIKDDYYFPVFTADLRIGGIFLPFDFDIAVMKTGTLSTDKFGCDLDVSLFTIGADFRYALLEGGLVLPKLSVGLGYFYNEGSFGAGSSNAETNIDYKVHTMYAQAQLSKKILFLTPFVGLRGLVSKYNNTWDWSLKGSALTSANSANDALVALGQTARKTSDNGEKKSENFDFNAIQPQIYAGLGVNFFVLQATLSVTADLRHITDDGLWSGAFSLRVKI